MSSLDFHSDLLKFPKVEFAHLPSPLEELPRLSKFLGGPKILIKRDDCSGLAMGGNKARKLEYLIADALNKGFDTVVTGGTIQSNHCRQTAAAAVKFGLRCILVLAPSWIEGQNGNILLDRILGAEVVLCDHGQPWEEKYTEIETEIINQGHSPYVIPTGGSNALGSLGYIAMINELLNQSEICGHHVNYVVSATGSGGTQAGMVAGTKLNKSSIGIVGISVGRKKEESIARVSTVIEEIGILLNQPLPLKAGDVEVHDEYTGQGYGVPTMEGLAAIESTARLEGVILDPVYTAKAMVGLMELIRKGRFVDSDLVVFLHTGGTPALFSYVDHFNNDQQVV